MSIHRELEQRLAAFEGSEACLLFGSGYLANLGTIGALAGPGDTIFSDQLNHASIIDGCRASRAEVVVYRHLDTDHLEGCLREHRGKGRRVIVSDSVFSMDGDVAPLARIVELARAYGARTIVDEAHATGALGDGGRGAVAQAGLQGKVDVLIGTLGKALGSYGAYACAGEEIVRLLINTSRPLIFSTAPSPPSVAGALAALELLQAEPERVSDLRDAARILRGALATEGLAVQRGDMHIVPIVVGDSETATGLCQAALERGVFAQAIRPPTVADGTSRLRLATMASHDKVELCQAAKVLAGAARELGLDPARLGEPSALAGAVASRGPEQASASGSSRASSSGSGDMSNPSLARIA
jgi:glycine C-acetyltransferase/8-amino-7-oxononanoate synthase